MLEFMLTFTAQVIKGGTIHLLVQRLSSESFTFSGKNETPTIVSTYHKVHFKMWTQVEPPSKFKMAASLPCLMYKYA